MKAAKTAAKKAANRKTLAAKSGVRHEPVRKSPARKGITTGGIDAALPALNAQLAELNVQIEAVRTARVAEYNAAVIACRQIIEAYGLTAADVGLMRAQHAPAGGGPSTPRATKSSTPIPPKYANPETGETWSGRGRAPGWINGQDREQFLVA